MVPFGFLGVAVPHLGRRACFRTLDHRLLVPASVLLGAILALGADLIAQLPGSQAVLPLNAVYRSNWCPHPDLANAETGTAILLNGESFPRPCRTPLKAFRLKKKGNTTKSETRNPYAGIVNDR